MIDDFSSEPVGIHNFFIRTAFRFGHVGTTRVW